ncbi:unnamed protein product [Echinostoma caproni]|uniref:UBP-type domain-containing protein n=1 Tax=Echinostoma caproni TaxID=27848 RepID=A0A3P8GQX1_9TREM|nr:unnamed protein product [Echinostoma caproni]
MPYPFKDSRKSSKSNTQRNQTLVSSRTAEEIEFYSGNPMVETTEGIIHDRGAYVCGWDDVNHALYLFRFVGFRGTNEVTQLEAIEELKVVKNDAPNRYMALLKFQTDQFYLTYNNTCYRNVESEVCQLMYVSHVEKTHPGLAFPTKDLLELPSCPVCLERLVSILTTILCNHTFHDQCIARVEDSTCPVCRYVQSPELLDDRQCADCGTRDNLWICLICGRIGCGRYGQKHAHRHFEQTGHTFALELGKNLVWDYVDDAYVHRLAVNHEDGKLVQSTSKWVFEARLILSSSIQSGSTIFEFRNCWSSTCLLEVI